MPSPLHRAVRRVPREDQPLDIDGELLESSRQSGLVKWLWIAAMLIIGGLSITSCLLGGFR
jgi:hypothetical protein